MKCPNCENDLICSIIREEENDKIVGHYICINENCQIEEVVIKNPA